MDEAVAYHTFTVGALAFQDRGTYRICSIGGGSSGSQRYISSTCASHEGTATFLIGQMMELSFVSIQKARCSFVVKRMTPRVGIAFSRTAFRVWCVSRLDVA
jgi:hypothetical protein